MLGRTLAVTSTAQQVIGSDGDLWVLQADPANTADLYIGPAYVTADTAATGGIRLPPGAGLVIRADPAGFVWAVAASGTQYLRTLAGVDLRLLTDAVGGSTAVQIVQGDTAGGVADAGNPVKIGGIANNGVPSQVSVGQRVGGWFMQNGATVVAIADTVIGPAVVRTTSVDAFAAGANGLATLAQNYLFNATSFDRARNNSALAILASAARTATPATVDLTNYNGRRLTLFVNVTALTATGTLTPAIAVKDSISGAYFTIWTAAAPIAATGAFVYTFDVGQIVTGAGSSLATEKLSFTPGARTVGVIVTHGNGVSITYSVSAEVGV